MKQRTDSTHILAVVRSLNRLELVGRNLQSALNAIAQHAPEWMQAHIPTDWFDRYRRQLDDDRLPKGANERQALARTIGNDGISLLEKLEQDEAVAEVRSHAAIKMLRQVWEQQYEIGQGQVRWREMKELLPSAKRIASPHDGEARYSTKRSVTWVGYKVHLSETCEEYYPSLVTHVETTLSTTDDIKALPTIHQELAKRDRLPGSHLADTAYGSAETLVENKVQYGIELVCPVSPDNSWQAHEAEAFDLGRFTLEWEAQRVRCPQGKANEHWSAGMGPRGRPTIQVQFRHADCRGCPARSRCTRSKLGARELTPASSGSAIQVMLANECRPIRRWRSTAFTRGALSRALPG